MVSVSFYYLFIYIFPLPFIPTYPLSPPATPLPSQSLCCYGFVCLFFLMFFYLLFGVLTEFIYSSPKFLEQPSNYCFELCTELYELYELYVSQAWQGGLMF